MLENRRFVVIGVFVFVGLIYVLRLFYLQVLDDTYSITSSSNSIKRVIEVPVRGQIYDRNGKLIVYNSSVYDLVVTPYKVKIPDTLALCRLLGMERTEFDSLMQAAREYSRVKPFTFLRQLSKEEFASIQDAMVDYEGFDFIKSTVRTYASASMANALGYVSEISKSQLEAQKEPYYRRGDYVGKSGIEKFYEEQLRGKRGVKFVMQNASGVVKGSWKNGELDTVAVAGDNLHTGIDLEVQQYADSLMINKVGSVVAIEPKTGQILVMASGPTYDPRDLTSRSFSKNYAKLAQNPYKPLVNRAVMGAYRPGSTFKPLQALVALEEGVITPGTGFGHAGSPIGCHNHPATGSVAAGIKYSCNPYFYHVFRMAIYSGDERGNSFKSSAEGLEKWRNFVAKFGFGQVLGVDLPSESRGLVPDSKYFDRVYGKQQWKFSNFASMGIGEGELVVNPIKVANLAAAIANKGYYYTPHIVAGIGNSRKPLDQYLVRHETGVSTRHFDVVTEGMIGAANGGTTRAYEQIRDILVAGKTGTSQNRKGKDSAIYMAMAPAEDPRIVIAVFVEYAGFGGTAAAPIAHLLIERYLKRKTENKELENRVLNTSYLGNVVLPTVRKPQPQPVNTAPEALRKRNGAGREKRKWAVTF